MSYLWNKFNIKTFAAETVVFRDGVFCPDLSTLKNTDIDKKYDLPVHVIYVGEIAGKCRLEINIGAENQPVFLSVNIKNKMPAFLNIFIKNAGKNSECRGHVFIENMSTINYECLAHHYVSDTGILINTKLLAHRNTKSKLSGTAIIEPNCEHTVSDVGFSAMADDGARIEFLPCQKIASVPDSAQHSATIYHATEPQIEYLRQAGLSGAEVDDAMREAFMNDFSLF